MIYTPDSPFASIGQLIIGMDTAMLTTADARGRLRSRPMMVQRFEPEGSLWFLTVRISHMVEDIRENPQVNVSLTSPIENLYISVTGTAFLGEDREEIKALWKSSYTMWFPEGPDDPELILLKVEVEDAEYWKSPAGDALQVYGFVKAVNPAAVLPGELTTEELITGIDDG